MTATAQTMAGQQREISVSEFFARNRHLLGFDNSRKALLTTVKEATDNSLDACEEARILPELWIFVKALDGTRFVVSVQDNGPGILKEQIPLVFGKLLYGSKFHRLRMSRGQQGIGISAAGMYGLLTTGKPTKVISKTGAEKSAHYYEIQIDTKRNVPEIINGKGAGLCIAPGEDGKRLLEQHEIDWVDIEHGTRVTIELEARHQRGKGSVDEYLEQTSLANPHARIHYSSPDGDRIFERSTDTLPHEPREIKPHPHGIDFGMFVGLIRDSKSPTIPAALHRVFSRVSGVTARRVCSECELRPTLKPKVATQEQLLGVYNAFQALRIPAPSLDCVVPLGEEHIMLGMRQIMTGDFYAAVTRPPAVYRGNPFVVEAGLVYGGRQTAHDITLEALHDLLAATDAKTLKQFLLTTFDGIGPEAVTKIAAKTGLELRVPPSKLQDIQIAKLHTNLGAGRVQDKQPINILRFANRVPLQFQAGGCAIIAACSATNWRQYGLSQARGSLPIGPVTLIVHVASVWVPFTSESKEAIANYPEILKEIRIALQLVGRKLATFLNHRKKSGEQGERRKKFLRYLSVVADSVSEMTECDRDKLFEDLVAIANSKTAEADAEFDDRGQKITG